MDLNVIWFILLGILLAGYAVLDGFDLGAGMLHPLARGNQERRLVLNSIGPLWDGNEVWLVTFGGALFAAFPEAYATIFSGFYIAFILVLFSLIFRAVSIEFRGKVHSPFWHTVWDYAFCGSSLLATLLFGVAVGAAMTGIPLNSRGVFVGGLFDQIGLYQMLVGLMTVALFATHGGVFLGLKTEGELRRRMLKASVVACGVFVPLYLWVTWLTVQQIPRATANFADYPWAYLVVVLAVAGVALLPWAVWKARLKLAFAASSTTIVSLVMLFGLALFPNMVTSNPHPENSLTIYNAASSQATLRLMGVIALLGMPFVFAYTAVTYWAFWGKTRLTEHSY